MKIYQNSGMGTESLEYMPATEGESYEPGEALVVSNGSLTKCTGTQKPVYICAQRIDKAEADTIIAVTRTNSNKTYVAQLSENGEALKIGDKISIADDGIRLTATTGGSAEIVSIIGTAVGDGVIVRF